MENIRELAVDMLSEIMERRSYCHLVIRSVLQKYNYRDSRDKAFLKRLVEEPWRDVSRSIMCWISSPKCPQSK
ncbi:MAG: hypothetical protein V8S42_03090 [Lachnospiraceae bacterium]